MHFEQRKIPTGVRIGSADITQRQTPNNKYKISVRRNIGSSVPLKMRVNKVRTNKF